MTSRMTISVVKSCAKAEAMLVIAKIASVVDNSMRRSMRLVSHAVTGEPMHRTKAPKVTSSPAIRTVTPRSAPSSFNMPAGANIDVPVTILPSIRAVGAKRFTAVCWQIGSSMQMHQSNAPLMRGRSRGRRRDGGREHRRGRSGRRQRGN